MNIVDYEELVLCALLLDPESIMAVGGELTPDRFSETARRTLYEAMLDMKIKSMAVDIPSILAFLGPKCAVVGGEAYLLSLQSRMLAFGVESAAGLPEWVRVVDGAGRLRHLGLVIKEYGRLYEDFDRLVGQVGDIDAFLADFMGKVQQVSAGRQSDYRDAAGVGAQLKFQLDLLGRGKMASIVNTGMPTLTQAMLFPRDGLTIVSGLSGMGKTALVMQAALGVAIKLREHNLPGMVAIHELEMPDWRLFARMASMLSGVNFLDIEKGFITPGMKGWRDFNEAVEFVMGLPIRVNDGADQTSTGAIFSCNTLHMQHGPLWFVALDYLELFKDRETNEEQRVAGIGRNAKHISRQTGAATVLVSQFNNSVMYTPGKVGGIGRLRYSGALGHAADVVVECYNPPAMKQAGIDYVLPVDLGVDDENYAWFLIEKYRNGKPGVVKAGWFPNLTAFKDLALARQLGREGHFFDTTLWYSRGQDEDADF